MQPVSRPWRRSPLRSASYEMKYSYILRVIRRQWHLKNIGASIMSFDSLKFPSGRTVKRCKQDAKEIVKNSKSSDSPIKYNEALNQVVQKNGLSLQWDKAIKKLELELKCQLQISAPNCIIISTDNMSKFGVSTCFDPIYLSYVGDVVPIDELKNKIAEVEKELKNKISLEEYDIYKRIRVVPFIGIPIKNIRSYKTTVYYENKIPCEGIKVYSGQSNRAIDLMFESIDSKYTEILGQFKLNPKITCHPGHTIATKW
jgi:hypothetical protein